MNFQRTKEDFICEHCGKHNTGNGYTNHCYNCLWSKHVDVMPGDRKETCGGLMEPISVIQKDNNYDLVHKCVKCGLLKNNRTWPEDNFDEIVKLAAIT